MKATFFGNQLEDTSAQTFIVQPIDAQGNVQKSNLCYSETWRLWSPTFQLAR